MLTRARITRSRDRALDRSRRRRLRPRAHAKPSRDLPLAEAPPVEDRITVPDLPPARDEASAAELEFFAEEAPGADAPLAAEDSWESVRPTSTDVELASAAAEAPLVTPELARRRRAMRRGVGFVVGAIGLAAAVAVGSTALRGVDASSAVASAAEVPANEVPADEVAPPAVAKPVPIPAAEDPRAENLHEEEPLEARQPEPADADAPPPVESGGAESSATDLRDLALALLNQGQRKEAIEVASRAIAADPTDALPYLVKGSAFMDLGDWPGAKAEFDACATHATHGSKYECLAMGGRAR